MSNKIKIIIMLYPFSNVKTQVLSKKKVISMNSHSKWLLALDASC